MQLPFQKKLFLTISVFIVGLMLACISAFSFYTYQNLYQHSIQSLNQLSERTGSELQTLFADMDNLALYASTNPEIRSAFTNAKAEEYTDSDLSKETVQTLTSISIPNSSSHYRISLYNRRGNFTSIGIPYNKELTADKLSSSDFSSWYDALPVERGCASFSEFHQDYWSDSHTLYLSLFREIFDKNFTTSATALIEIQCPYNKVQSILNFHGGNYSGYLFDRKGSLIYPTTSQKLSASLYEACEKSPQGYLPNHSRLFYSSTEIQNEFRLVLVQSERYIWQIILPQILTILFMGLAALFFCIVVLFYVTKRATKPLHDLTASVKQVSYSNLSLELEFSDYPDEISSLNEAFEKMFHRLRQSMDEIVKMQACEMRANMVALQAQMDPHFLYNTLTVIKALSREGNTRQISLTCDYLVRMLRYISAYDEHSTSLKQELTHTENYLNLMKIRFEDQFTYSFSIDSTVETENLMLPKLTLQPLVENCFQHGFKAVAPPWNIRIRFWLEAPRWFLSVTDNGAGISPEKKQELLEKIREFLSHPSDSILSMKIGGMGLINTVARLQLKYKEQISFEIINLPEGGTSIILGGVLEDEYLCD